MPHGTRINGTSYGITGGRCMVNGTAYDIKKGRTMVNGTIKEITISGNRLTITGISGEQRPQVKIDGQPVYEDGEYDINEGSTIYLYMEKYREASRLGIFLDGVKVGNDGLFSVDFSFIAEGSYDIVYTDSNKSGNNQLVFDITTK